MAAAFHLEHLPRLRRRRYPRVIYEGFTGTLPRITKYRHLLIGISVIIDIGLGISCRYGHPTENAAGEINIGTSGEANSITADNRIRLRGFGEFGCPARRRIRRHHQQPLGTKLNDEGNRQANIDAPNYTATRVGAALKAALHCRPRPNGLQTNKGRCGTKGPAPARYCAAPNARRTTGRSRCERPRCRRPSGSARSRAPRRSAGLR